MTTFSYSSGNPSNLTGGHAASMSDISGPLTDIPTFLNGNIDTTNLAASAKPVTLLGQYRTVSEVSTLFPSTTSGAFRMGATGVVVSGFNSSVSFNFVPILAADYSVSGLTAKLRMRAVVVTNATAPAVTFTFGLYPITASGGGSGLNTTTLGTVVSGSTVAFATPSGTTTTASVGTDFSLPADGVYALGVATNGTTAANSYTLLHARLEVHHV